MENNNNDSRSKILECLDALRTTTTKFYARLNDHDNISNPLPSTSALNNALQSAEKEVNNFIDVMNKSSEASRTKRKSSDDAQSVVSKKKSRGSSSSSTEATNTSTSGNSPSSSTSTSLKSSDNDLTIDETLEVFLAQGHAIVPILGDGNCLYRAVSHQLYGHEDKHMELRLSGIDHIRANPERYKQAILGVKNMTPAMHVFFQKQAGVQADEFDITSVANSINRRIIIYHSGDKANVIDPDGYDHGAAIEPIRLAYNSRHYESVVPNVTVNDSDCNDTVFQKGNEDFDSLSEEDNDHTAETTRDERRKKFEEFCDGFTHVGSCEELEKLIEELQSNGTFVYQLRYINKDGKIIIFWTGISKNPNMRWKNHPNEVNEEKQKIFKSHGDSVSMRILYKGTFVDCLILEHLLIHNHKQLGHDLVNRDKKEAEIHFHSNVLEALNQLLENADKIKMDRTKSKKFDNSIEGFSIDPETCPQLVELLAEFKEEGCFVYGLFYRSKDGKITKFYIGITLHPEIRLRSHRNDYKKNEQKWNIIRNNKSRTFMKIFFKGTRAVCEVLELLLIQDDTETKLTNVSKRYTEKPNVNADINVVVSELKRLEKSSEACLFVNDAKRITPVNDFLRLKLIDREKVRKRLSAKVSGSKVSTELGIIANVHETEAIKNLQNLLCFKDKPGFKFLCHFGQTRTSIVYSHEVFEPEKLVGTFKSFKYEQMLELFIVPNDVMARWKTKTLSKADRNLIYQRYHQLMVFYARVGIIPNLVKCSKCGEIMILRRDMESASVQRWVCFIVGGKSCSTTIITKNEFVFRYGILFQQAIQIIYLYSQGRCFNEICTAIGKDSNKTQNTMELFIRSGDESLNTLVDSGIGQGKDKYRTIEDFFADKDIDHFGLILYWIRKKYPLKF